MPCSVNFPSGLQPFQYIRSILIRWKNRIPHLQDLSIFNSQCESFYQRRALRRSTSFVQQIISHQRTYLILENGQPQPLHQSQLLIAQNLIRHPNPLPQLLLIRCTLRTTPKHLLDSQGLDLGLQVAKSADLRSASSGARDGVPFFGNAFAWGRGARVAEENREARQGGDVDGCAVCAWESKRIGDVSLRKMVAGAVVLGYWYVLW